MKSRLRPTWLLILPLPIVALLLGLGRSFGPANDIPAGTGYAALDLCTRTLVSGEALDYVRTHYVEPQVQPLPDIWQVSSRPNAGVEVRTVLPTLQHPRAAVLRPGRGCTVVPPGTTEAELRGQPFKPAPEQSDDARPWPHGEGAVETQRLDAGLRETIERHATRIFESSAELKPAQNTTVLLVAHGGHLVYERYAAGHTRANPQLGWSMTKSLTAIIAGLLATDGTIALDAPVGLPQWKDTDKQAITWRQLLNMSPGLSWFEGYGGKSDATDMLFSQANQGAWAADLPLTDKPGSVFMYSTGTSTIAMLRMRQLLGGEHQGIYDYYQSRLFAPLGIRHGVIEPDASGTPVGGARGVLRPVDWLRLGQLMANGGTWNGATLLAPEYVSFLTAASPADAGYGGSLWREPSMMLSPEIRARVPDDLVLFAGYLGQYTVIVPSRNLVVLRMGVSTGAMMERDDARNRLFELVADLVEANWPEFAAR